MQRRLNWLFAAALAAGGLTFVTAYAADDANSANSSNAPAAQKPADQNLGAPGTVVVEAKADAKLAADTQGPLALPAGAKAVDKKVEPADLAKVIGKAAEGALNKGDFDDVVSCLVDQDRDRLGDHKSFDFKTLDGRIDQVLKAFKDKYGEDFSIDKDKVFADAQAIEGEIEDPNQFVQNWPVAPIPGLDAAVAGSRTQVVDEDTRKNGNIEKGRNIAIVRLPAQGDIPALNVSEIRELTGWKIDIPNDRKLQQIHDDLLKHLTMVGENTANWPTDKEGAKGMIARHVVMGLYGIDLPLKKS